MLASASIFAALGDDTRLAVVERLSHGGPMSIVRLSDGSGVTRQAVTKHLHVLAAVGLVRNWRHGRETLWAFDPQPLSVARRSLDDIERAWDAALGRRRALVERPEGTMP